MVSCKLIWTDVSEKEGEEGINIRARLVRLNLFTEASHKHKSQERMICNNSRLFNLERIQLILIESFAFINFSLIHLNINVIILLLLL